MWRYSLSLVFASSVALSSCIFATGCADADPEITNIVDFVRPTPQADPPLVGDHVRVEPARWLFKLNDWTTGVTGAAMTTTKQMSSLVLPLSVNQGELLTDVDVAFLGAGGHATLPKMPRVQVQRTNPMTFETTVLAEATDNSQSVSEYQDVHHIRISDVEIVFEPATYRYEIVIDSEYGPNAIAGAYVNGVMTRVLPGL